MDSNFWENINIGVFDVLDVLIVGYLMYLIYKLLKGTIAFNIFIGVLLLYLIFWVVEALNMRMLSLVLGKFVGYGVIILIIIFQPEVRKFLLMLGNNTLKGRIRFLQGIFGNQWNENTFSDKAKESVESITNTLDMLSTIHHGALVVISNKVDLSYWTTTGTKINADISEELLRNIFYKGSPLHDGAVVIEDDKILAASVVLPVTQQEKVPSYLGLRHRAALGMSEQADVLCCVVSEENGAISWAYGGRMYSNKNKTQLKKRITQYLKGKN